MSETIYPNSPSEATWPNNEPKVRLPETSVTSGRDKAPAAVDLVNHAVRGAHDTIDRLAERAVPAARQLGERADAAGEALQAKTDRLRETRDEWAEAMRATVRGNPLVSVTAALAAGFLIARITR